MINGAECTICASKDCFDCAKVKGKVTLAEGDQIFRWRDEIYPHLVTLDLSVAALPDNSVMTFKPLVVTDIKKALELESKHVNPTGLY